MNAPGLFATALAIVLLLPSPASACRCMAPPPPAQALEGSTAVFSGLVLRVNRQGDHEKAVVLQVETVWKGGMKTGADVTITTCADSACCGFGFEAGERYLVYAHGEAGRLSVSLCSRTRPLDGADEDVAALHAIAKPAVSREGGTGAP